MFAQQHKHSYLRFRGWSRKSAAAFHSVGKHVTIGNLKTVIADSFLGKQNNIFSTRWEAAGMPISDKEKTEDPPDDALLTEGIVLLPVASTLKGAGTQGLCAQFTKKINYLYNLGKIWLVAGNAISHFLFVIP